MPIPADAVLTVLLYSSLAALIAAAGVLPFAGRAQVPMRWLGCAFALASGFMLGAAYILMAEGLRAVATLPTILGAGLGVGYTFWTHSYSGTGEIETLPDEALGPVEGYKLILLSALHSASEGVAIGAGMAVSLHLGIFLALALAVHNIAEAMGLTSILRLRKIPLRESAGLCVITAMPQALLAIVAFSLVSAAPAMLPWTLGFSAGAMMYLVLTELIPASYRQAGRGCVAVLVSLSAGAIVMAEGLLAR